MTDEDVTKVRSLIVFLKNRIRELNEKIERIRMLNRRVHSPEIAHQCEFLEATVEHESNRVKEVESTITR